MTAAIRRIATGKMMTSKFEGASAPKVCGGANGGAPAWRAASALGPFFRPRFAFVRTAKKITGAAIKATTSSQRIRIESATSEATMPRKRMREIEIGICPACLEA